MSNELISVLKKENKNQGVLSVLIEIKKLADTAKGIPGIAGPAAQTSAVIGTILSFIKGNITEEEINLDELFVKPVSETLKDKGIDQSRIDKILNGEK